MTHTFTSAGGSTILTVSFTPGTFGQGDSTDFGSFFTDILDGPSDPISVIFNFADGFASQAGFDAVTGADSGFGSFSFVGNNVGGLFADTAAADTPNVEGGFLQQFH